MDIKMENQYSSLFQGQNKKISCKHEIIFNITASVVSENESGEDAGYEEICTKHYHIPVKEDADYKEFMNSFFNFLEGCLANSAQKAYEKDTGTKND
jgi:hypothetical protein